MKENELIEKYISLVLEENEKINLTSITDIDEFKVKHIEDSLLPSKSFDFNNKIIMDLGSGAGFPGIPLAIYFPNSTFYLVEPTRKRALFLEKVKEELELKNVIVINKRVEELSKDEKFDVIVSRAVKELRILLELSIPYLKVNGVLVSYKGDRASQELDEAENAFKKLNCHLLMAKKDCLSNGDTRTNLFIIKDSETDPIYPRRFNNISKKPL